RDAGAQATVAGVVRDSASGAAVSGAEVRVAGTTARMRTGEDGAFQLRAAEGGLSTLEVRRLGFRPASLEVGGGAAALQIVIASIPFTLAPLVIRAEHARFTGRLAGYYERLSKRTQGVFITRADLDRERPPQLTDMLQRSPGVRVTRGRPGAQSIRMRGRDCRPLVWLDGAPMSSGDVDLDSFAPTTLEGIELYLGSNAPAHFTAARGQSDCGTILLWSRGPDTEPPRAPRSVSTEELEALIASFGVFTSEQVDTAAARVGPEGWRVPYPPSLQAAGVRGSVSAEFVVDTLGRVEPARVGIVSSTDRFFSAAVAGALVSAQFRPAVRRGRRVRQLVRQTFDFEPESPAR
ncbi:MAG: TonB family protein, partial [Gemmatimonadetes bacterium]|nr:TonB family protein [Gemmatimonadota bacterium]